MEDYEKVITWSDNRWTDGSIYEKIGFVFDKNLPIDYCYTKNEKIVSKQSRSKKQSKCPNDMTEVEWSHYNKWYRIWDCGKKRWAWTKEEGVKLTPSLLDLIS